MDKFNGRLDMAKEILEKSGYAKLSRMKQIKLKGIEHTKSSCHRGQSEVSLCLPGVVKGKKEAAKLFKVIREPQPFSTLVIPR